MIASFIDESNALQEDELATAERLALISKIEELRGSKVICYLTSVRPNVGAQIAQDAVRVFFEHLRFMQSRPVDKIDIFLCSNGGNGTVPWRLISLLREYATNIGVLLPYRAYSAATMLALGADEIVMHPFAEMGPIDPTVTNDYNPIDPQTNQRTGISVEDVKAYVSFIKDTVGIRHEDELVKAIKILAEKVHPLALGNVERFIAQSRMITRKILLTHMNEETSKHKIDEIIETLASKLYFHGHPINRKEARDLGLQISENPAPELEQAMWDLYVDFEKELKNDEIYDPVGELFNAAPPPDPIAVANNTATPALPAGTYTVNDLTLALVESARLSSVFSVRKRLVVVGHQNLFEPILREEGLRQEWVHTLVQPTGSDPTSAPAPSEAHAPVSNENAG